MRRQGVFPSRVTYTAAVAGLNRPRYAEWGPKLEKLAMLLHQRANTSWDDRHYRKGGGRRDEDREGENGGFAGDIARRPGWKDEIRRREGERANEAGERSGYRSSQDGRGKPGVEDGSRNDPRNSLRNALDGGPSREDFDGSIEALGDAGHANGAACLLRVMRREGFHASPRAYRSVIYACARIGLLSEAVALAKEMEAESDYAGRRRRQSRPLPSGSNMMFAAEQATDLDDAAAVVVDSVSGGMMGSSGTEGDRAGVVGTSDGVDQTLAIVGDSAQVAFRGQQDAYDATTLSAEEIGEERERSSAKVEVVVGGGRPHNGSTSSATTTATTTLSGHGAGGEPEEDGEEEYDLGVVYNCIVCNFARAAASGAFDEIGDGGWGSAGVSGATPAAVAEGDGGKADEGGLVSLLMDVTERAEGALDNEAANGGVVLAEGLESTSAAVAEAEGLEQLSSTANN